MVVVYYHGIKHAMCTKTFSTYSHKTAFNTNSWSWKQFTIRLKITLKKRLCKPTWKCLLVLHICISWWNKLVDDILIYKQMWNASFSLAISANTLLPGETSILAYPRRWGNPDNFIQFLARWSCSQMHSVIKKQFSTSKAVSEIGFYQAVFLQKALKCNL